MIRVICPGCGAKLNAKPKLAGQTRDCPKCGASVLIPKAEGPSSEEASGVGELGPIGRGAQDAAPSLEPYEAPKKLRRGNRYLICDNGKVVAAWKDDGHGWMLRTTAGWVSAARNPEQLPNQGNFKLVELGLEATEEGLRLQTITSYQLAPRWALTRLTRGDEKILAAVTGPGCLNRAQKDAIRQLLVEQLMRDVWKDAAEVLDYLANTDYHSPGTR